MTDKSPIDIILLHLSEIIDGKCSISNSTIKDESDEKVSTALHMLNHIFEKLDSKPNEKKSSKINRLLQENADLIKKNQELTQSVTRNKRSHIATLNIMEDINQAKIQLEKQKNLLESKNKELEQFAYIASHDLQEPLRTIINYTDFLYNDYIDKFDHIGTKSLSFINQATNRMQSLVKGLLVYSRIGRERKKSSVDIQKIITNITHDYSAIIKEKKALIKFNNLPMIEGFELELRILFQNLINNAIKFSQPSEPPIIEIVAKENLLYWEFSISDNGIGIEKADINKIFVIFQRLHTSAEYQGTGIGLAHSQKIVELHSGDIWVKSVPNEGSTFCFTITKHIGDIHG